MSDVNTFIDEVGKDVSAALLPKVETLAQSISAKACDEFGPRVSAFGNRLVKDLIDAQAATVRDFMAQTIQDLFQRYRPEVGGELHTRIVQGGVEVTGRGIKLDLKRRDTGAPVSSLDIPVSFVIKVDTVGVTLQNATINLDVIR